ncbi:uncharacterized protein BDR25DRAFT_343074 [Lindgomyces ingoldianus]|uniref:Uncharacterized protein n=1 Tax=Lindgomyces ingoldianus TaxID=673940 RepID=A0ACB6QTT5_9PLEO|nr:uncharacterized protein BDR25DRAFT_343074 [Lindgomyces ingoldianus]KAF2470295.1 hypothetical protein BDR25DRAFT_343074 [Lindgomyces ingoldianus]
MADMDPELAFLNSQAEYDPAGDYSTSGIGHPEPVADDGEEDEYDPSALPPSYPDGNDRSPSDQSASMPESPGNTPSPATENALKPQPADAASAVPTPPKQPRTMGGFVDESEDDEDDVPVSRPMAAGSALLNASGGSSATPQRSLTQTPNNTLPPSTNVPLHSAQDQGHSGVSSSTFVTVNDAAPTVASSLPGAGTPAPDATKSAVPDRLNTVSARPSTTPVTPVATSLPKPRLSQDRVGILEDRIAEDPRGDMEAWLDLIAEHRKRHKIDDARAVYDRFFKVFPSAAEQWVQYVQMETDLDEFSRIERLFERSIMATPHVDLWSTYISYIRRRNNLTTDQSGNARQIITQVYEFVLDNVGIDVNSGRIWHEYIEFIKSGPGIVGGSNWQDMQKMDTLRKVYQRAIAVPTSALLEIWREYDRFELSFNKAAGRKNLQEKSPFYMTARSANNVLDNITRGIDRTTLPKLPPRPGFDGYDDYMTQVNMWKHWIQWEKDDPLILKEDDRALMNKRIVYLYKHALMALRFWPELWYDAAEWCFQNNMDKEGNEFLAQGVEANPESCLLAFRKAHQVELSGEFEDGEAGIIRKGEAVREPFNKVLDALYDLTNQTKRREEHSLVRAKETFEAQRAADEASRANSDGGSDEDGGQDDDDEEAAKQAKEKEARFQAQLQAISTGYNAEIHDLKKTISYAWIALMRTMRRIQGKGSPAGTPPGFRGIFAEARKKGRLLSDAYVASALIEHHCYQDPAAAKIFERGMKLFPDDENFALEYIKHLVNQNDATNARAVFETVVNRLTQKPGSIGRAKPLFKYFHEYESQFGELAQIIKLEKRMTDLFPEDPRLLLFSQRFSTTTFDPTIARPVISPKTQMKPVMMLQPTIEEPLVPLPPPQEKRPSPVLNSPRVPPASLFPITNSPKRPFDESDSDFTQPRKMIRGESPLKGAAGRRLDAARRNMARTSEGMSTLPVAPPPPDLPRDVKHLLHLIPGAHTYKETRFIPEMLVRLLQTVDLSKANLAARPPTLAPSPAPATPSFPPPPMGAWGPPPAGMSGFYGR